MRRKTLDVLFSIGGFGLAALLLVLGFVMMNNANFSKSYVHDQLAQQQITFTPKASLKPEEAKSACLVKYAGQPLVTGKQAECYANDYIGLHVKSIANGATYATLGTQMTALNTQIAAAQKSNDPNLPNLQKQLATMTTQRETLFKGETLRGLLLSSFGFSKLGEKAGQAAAVMFAVAGLLALLSVAGFVHAFTTSQYATVGMPERKRPLHAAATAA